MPLTSHDFFVPTAIVHCADIFVRAMDFGNGGDDKIPQMADVAWKQLGFDSVQLVPLFEKIRDEVDKATVFLQLT